MRYIFTSVFSILLLAGFALSLDNNAVKVDPNKVLAEIAGYKITEGMLDDEISDMPPQISMRYTTPEGRRQLLDQLITERVLLNEAKEKKLDKDGKMERQIRRAGNQILISEFYRTNISGTLGIDESKAKQYYDNNKDIFRTKRQAKLHHIGYEKEEDALAARKRIDSKETNFATEAEKSTDTTTARSTGLLGFVTEGARIQALGGPEGWSDAVFSLKPGELSQPVKTETGWHLFLVDEQKPEEYIPYEQVKMQVREKMLVSEEDIKSYYQNNREKYAVPAGVLLSIIISDTEAESTRIKGLVAGGKMAFSTAAQKYSVDRNTRDKNGDIGWIREGQYVPTIGRDAAFEKAVLALKLNEIAGPMKTEKGYVIAQCRERRETGYRDLSDIHDQISSQLFSERSRQIVTDLIENLKLKNKVKYVGNMESASDLLAKAESAATSLDRVKYYERLVTLYPNDQNANKALFMTGFIYSEELKDYDKARAAFQRLLRDFPQSEFVPSAKWMMENMGKEDAGLPKEGE